MTHSLYATFWALVPPLIAIALALLTKEVFSSLFIGIFAGALLYTGFSPVAALEHMFFGAAQQDGETVAYGMIPQLTSRSNAGILVFLVVLGTLVVLMNRAGGSAAFGRWASAHIKSRVGAQLATVLLGVLIFVDDYFNCLTIGSVMRPLTDKHGISHEKLAYLIDATAAPVCIIAPISSWAAAVTGFVDGVDGLSLFIRAIPYNFYALLTIATLIALSVLNFDFGPMALAERTARLEENAAQANGSEQPNPKGRVIHLTVPILLLVICCVTGMIYTGGFFDGVGFVEAFSASDASMGLVYGSVAALLLTLVLYLCSGVLRFRTCMACLSEGFQSMVPAILILTFAWTLKGMTDALGAREYVAALVRGSAEGLQALLPAIFFVVAGGMAFATGTSWGTFGILIPIAVDAFGASLSNELMIISIAACMAGAVCGDHCSPISDTTIMASAGAQCDHIRHVSTQLPYALTTAGISLVGYLLAGFVQNAWIVLPLLLALTVGLLAALRTLQHRRAASMD